MAHVNMPYSSSLFGHGYQLWCFHATRMPSLNGGPEGVPVEYVGWPVPQRRADDYDLQPKDEPILQCEMAAHITHAFVQMSCPQQYACAPELPPDLRRVGYGVCAGAIVLPPTQFPGSEEGSTAFAAPNVCRIVCLPLSCT